MRKYTINSIAKCKEMIAWLHEHNYSQFQWQYDAAMTEGFFMWFISVQGLEDIEIHTFKPAIQDMLVKYNRYKKTPDA